MIFCKHCNRDVGVEIESKAIIIAVLVIVGLLFPLWIITLPIFWGIAFYKDHRERMNNMWRFHD